MWQATSDDIDGEIDLIRRAQEADAAREQRQEADQRRWRVRARAAWALFLERFNESYLDYTKRMQHRLTEDCRRWGATRLPEWPE